VVRQRDAVAASATSVVPAEPTVPALRETGQVVTPLRAVGAL
jgi:hypothetical protein